MEYDYYWGEEEKFYIEELSADLTKNIVRTINHGWDILGGHMNKEQVVIELIDADTGKAFRTDRRYVFIESTRTYPAPNKLTTDNGNVYYFDKDNKNNHLSIKVSKLKKAVMYIKQEMSSKHIILQRKIREILRRFVFLIWIPLLGNWYVRKIKMD